VDFSKKRLFEDFFSDDFSVFRVFLGFFQLFFCDGDSLFHIISDDFWIALDDY
jgi:hypothetical protein